LTPICTKSFVGWGFAPDTTGGAYSAPRHLAVFREPTSTGMGGERREGRGGESRERRGREERRREGREEGEERRGEREFVFCPIGKKEKSRRPCYVTLSAAPTLNQK